MPNFETTFMAIASKNGFLTHEEAAEVLGLTVGTIYRKLRSGDLAGFQLGRTWRIPPAELEKLRQREAGEA